MGKEIIVIIVSMLTFTDCMTSSFEVDTHQWRHNFGMGDQIFFLWRITFVTVGLLLLIKEKNCCFFVVVVV